ncbi:hypothetical protein CLAFUW4_08196 [Fulvia fulva]|uniref:Uncharacterized protein n=1 Tax=Passalora fulva TaxID=5499 RepID=A0A9Q8P6U6_PASFU|nr:uncharacterized protein CLAFUR5_08309 [Fulvia fulva]KAK4629687.1 hypothetical protein CLAFUR4_08201 [Fulvia fulva]KAK4630312.1 hypothetical protein CLAFUR0_08196 [Fulvia fulva]UJO15403.1 hypothetical protein CLAFUR5_08309 [Fulvia fulva]WPV12600.1 hypothetical protein CLAFUW4_08196 [Fulvia fulva]WPV27155.1 hypothetical protein CLAFUW7_08196 [Fulvia fulva]
MATQLVLKPSPRPEEKDVPSKMKVKPATGEVTNPIISIPGQILYDIHTLYLFTRSDLKSIVLPQALFSIACAMSAAPLTQSSPMSIADVARRVPFVVGWTWIHLLVENIENQRSEHSIIEDRVNKPWRSLPSGRLTPGQARTWLLWAVCVALLTSAVLGALKPSVVLLAHIWLYNDASVRVADTLSGSATLSTPEELCVSAGEPCPYSPARKGSQRHLYGS